jgi:flagellar assembly protein FliH
MTGSQKFSFNREFAGRTGSLFARREEAPSIPLVDHEAEMVRVRAEAFEAGCRAGDAAARGEEAARLARAVEALTETLRQRAGAIARIEAAAGAEAITFARVFAERLSGERLAEAPMRAIEAAARTAFEDLRGAPHMAARVAPDLVEATEALLKRLAREVGYEGRLVVLGEPDIAVGDARIEWADGGVVRDQERLRARVAEAVRAVLKQIRDDAARAGD